MSRLRLVLACLVSFAACRTLPSSTPLADTGEGRSFDDGALSRNRVPPAERASRASHDGHEDEHEDEDDVDETVLVVATAAVPTDAGAPEAADASTDAGSKGSAWAGEYFGSDRHVRRVTGVPDETALDDKAHTRVEEPTPGELVISLVSSADGQVICAVKATAKGNHAELGSGESCPGLMLMPPLEVSGSARLDGDRLVVELEGHG
jgi:hypothetical protein